jgi:hypothetical protein
MVSNMPEVEGQLCTIHPTAEPRSRATSSQHTGVSISFSFHQFVGSRGATNRKFQTQTHTRCLVVDGHYFAESNQLLDTRASHTSSVSDSKHSCKLHAPPSEQSIQCLRTATNCGPLLRIRRSALTVRVTWRAVIASSAAFTVAAAPKDTHLHLLRPLHCMHASTACPSDCALSLQSA